MSDTLTIIISILVPTISIQFGTTLFIFRRMDRMEKRLTQRMDRADEDRVQIRAEIREDSEKTRAELVMLQTGVARLEGAIDVLKGLVERFVAARR